MPTETVSSYAPYRSRVITFAGVQSVRGWRLKCYSVTHAPPTPDFAAFADGVDLALQSLPGPDPASGRLGVGFIVGHAGREADYVVLGWWDRQNELPVKVIVRDRVAGASWRPAAGGESFCVWDLQVIAAERDSYVATVLAGGDLDAAVEGYLSSVFSTSA